MTVVIFSIHLSLASIIHGDKATALLTHWGQVTHIYVSKLTSVGSDNSLSPGRCQAIIWANAGILLIGPLRTNFSENLIKIHLFSFKKMHLKMSSGKWHPFCLGLNVLMAWCHTWSKSTLQWHHNECDGISNHQPDDYTLNCLFRCR